MFIAARPGRLRTPVAPLAAALCLAGLLGCENLDRYGPEDGATLAAPIGLVAVPVSASEISLVWSSAPASTALTYRVYRAGTEVGTTEDAAYSDGALTASTTYTYTVVAIDGYGSTSAPSNPASATTLAPGQTDDEAPTPPMNLRAVAGSPTTIRLQWDPSSDDVGVLGYRIYRGGVEIAIAGTPEYTDQGLTPATAYTYTVAAFDGAAHLSPQSASAEATSNPADPGVCRAGSGRSGFSSSRTNRTVRSSFIFPSGVSGPRRCGRRRGE